MIAPDAREHGKSTLPPGKVSPDIFWQDADALLTHLNVESAVICGLSLDTHTALQMAIHAPQKVEALILIGAPCTNRFNLYERICVPINRFFMKLLPISWTAMCMSLILAKDPETKRYIKNTVSALIHNNFSRVWDAVTRMESRFCYPFFSPAPHDTNLGSRYKVRRQLRLSGLSPQNTGMHVIPKKDAKNFSSF